jgi:hypothetical protein
MTQPPTHPEFDDQVRTSSVARFVEVADKVAGGQVRGFQRDGDCKTCGHDWRQHAVFMINDTEQPCGYISCPEPACACSTTWGLGGVVPPTRCEYGLTIRTADDLVLQCPLPAGGLLVVDRDDLAEGGLLEVPMCTQHLLAMPSDGDAQVPAEGL